MKKNSIDPGIAKFEFRPASSEEAGLFYAMPPEQDAELGCIGHVRIDFDRNGDSFYHTWHPRGPQELNTHDFRDELTQVVDELRESVLKDFRSMKRYCRDHGGEIGGGRVQNYGYVVETDHYRYCLRCNPLPGDYQAYLTCFDKRVQEMSQAQADQDEGPKLLEIRSLAALKRAIQPGTELMATYHAKHPEIVGLVRVVTLVRSVGFYSTIKDQPDHKYSVHNCGLGFRSDFQKASDYQFDGTTVRVLDAKKGDGSVLCEFEVYEPEMKMEEQKENKPAFTMTMGGM